MHHHRRLGFVLALVLKLLPHIEALTVASLHEGGGWGRLKGGGLREQEFFVVCSLTWRSGGTSVGLSSSCSIWRGLCLRLGDPQIQEYIAQKVAVAQDPLDFESIPLILAVYFGRNTLVSVSVVNSFTEQLVPQSTRVILHSSPFEKWDHRPEEASLDRTWCSPQMAAIVWQIVVSSVKLPKYIINKQDTRQMALSEL